MPASSENYLPFSTKIQIHDIFKVHFPEVHPGVHIPCHDYFVSLWREHCNHTVVRNQFTKGIPF